MAGVPGSSRLDQAREVLEARLFEFAKYVNPHYSYGEIHEEVFSWFETNDLYQLLLMPRGHLKSHCIAVWCVWWITKFPHTSIVYLSAGEDLAEAQIEAIKGMITCDRYRRLWPDMIKKEEFKRNKWTASSFNVDHPQRKKMGTRDRTIIVKTIKSNFVGLHCDVMIYDDVVVDTNAYTETGRNEVKKAVAKCASIKNPGAITKAVGTIYHPADIYNTFEHAEVPIWNDDIMDFEGVEALWNIRKYELETAGDLTGDYLWPRVINSTNGESYGFDMKVMLMKRAEYFASAEHAQFYAQYYNDPNDPESEKVDRSTIQYYDPKHIKFVNGHWYYKQRRLNLSAGMDVAWTEKKRSDYTAIGVIGIDFEWNIYVLALDRFKTQDFDTYYNRVNALYAHWGFKKLEVESNAGGQFVAKEVKQRVKNNGGTLLVEGKAATGNEGKKAERHNAILIPRVKNGQVFFARGGLTEVAIEEIVLERPPHDDLKDVLTISISKATPPPRPQFTNDGANVRNIRYHKRFGGRVR